MRKYSSNYIVLGVAVLTVLSIGFTVENSYATPNPTGVVFVERVFNDCPTSILTTDDNYPMMVGIQDAVLDCGGFANLHVWRFSEDGANPAIFANGDAFSFCAILTITGTADGEAGLQISPWWSPSVDGRFNVRSTDGEIACFGGRLPFYSFSGSHGVFYEKGNSIFLRVLYLPNDLNEDNPATIVYELIYDGMPYSSGPLAFDMGNPEEDPPYGLWGMLNEGQAGAHLQAFLQPGNPDAWIRAEWTNICFENLDTVPTETSTWGGVKALYR
jgi:hypothetical protein